MKVLHVISSGGMYGAEAVILNLSHEFNAGGEHFSSIAVFSHAGMPPPALHEAALQASLSSDLLPCAGQVDLSFPGKLRLVAGRVGADVIHAHGYKADLYTYFAYRGRRDRPALVSTCHTWYDNDLAVKVYGALDRWVLRSFDQVVAVSEDVSRRLLAAGVRKQRVSLIQNGIVVERFSEALVHRQLRRNENGPLRVGLVGRLAPEKGVDLYLRAVAQIAAQVPAVQFLVAGDGPDRGVLEVLLGELGLQKRAELVGRQSAIVDFLGSLDLLVSASRHEGLPVALLEGMASGLPVVATRVGAVPQIVEDGKTGLLVPAEDSAALAGAMARLLDHTEERVRFGAAGAERVRNLFSAQRMAEGYLAVYRAAVAVRDGASRLRGQGTA